MGLIWNKGQVLEREGNVLRGRGGLRLWKKEDLDIVK